jgi:hypothetical protein
VDWRVPPMTLSDSACRSVAGRRTLIRRLFRAFVSVLAVAVVLTLALEAPLYAQDEGGGPQPNQGMGSEQNGTGANHVHIPEPPTASMMAAPPYGVAPLTVGFFVIATDPENVGFLTYEWNFGDGTVSSLPPELYIFHVYKQPGNYVISLIMTTVDGRSITLFTSVIVRPPPG